MSKVKKIMFTCIVNIAGVRLWLKHSEYDKNISIKLDAQFLTFSWNMVVERGHYDRFLTR